MSDKKIKHMEFVQAVITRMNTNSFLLKGWAITLVVALVALAVQDSNIVYPITACMVVAVFWVLDGFFISQERRYSDLYNEVRRMDDDQIDFDMGATRFFNNKGRSWMGGMFSKTLFPFYAVPLMTITMVGILVGNCHG